MHDGIAILGNLNTDLLMGPLAHAPEFGREMFVPARSLRAAGQAFYTAAALAALGHAPQLVGDVGDDAFGQQIVDDLRSAGLDTAAVRVCHGLPTGLSLALLNEQRDRAFVTHPGHLEALDMAAVAARWEHIAGRRMLLFCGYCCLPGLRPAGGEALLCRARAEGLVTVLDTGWDPGNWENGGREEVRALLRHTDVFLPNMEEARALTGRDDPDGAAAQLASWGPGTVIVKLGPAGVLGVRGGERERVPALATTVADTVGAGDCFNAGVLYALVRDWPLAEALRLGTAVAGYAIAGRQPRYATIEQARELMGCIPAAGVEGAALS